MSKIETASLSKSELSDKLIEIEQFYKVAVSGLSKMDVIITDELISNINHIKDNYYWYEKLVIPNSNFTVDGYQ
ncbi:hypothetical protein [Winogradskyella sp.]|uniref:hypothetical protein n=1 Tax=Winogradskyella sp. TaxID=1883156 RepID=UPI003F6C70EF